VEVQDVDEEAGVEPHVLAGEEDVVDPGRRETDEAERLRRRVGVGQQVADLLHAVDQFHHMPARHREPDRLSVPGADLPVGEALHLDPGVRQPGLVDVEVGGLGDLPAHVDQTVGGGERQDDRVVLVLVPALEEDAVRLARRLVHADDLGVVRGRELEVGHADLDVGQAQDAHVCTDMNRWFSSPS
jgi:hypothetical protein